MTFKPASLDLLWIGGEGGMEEDLVKRQGIPFQSIPAAGLHGVSLRVLPRNLITLARGYFASLSILRNFKPDVLFFTGGFVTVPMAFAAERSIPSLMYVPDIEPGMALKSSARFADQITLTTEESRKFFDKKSNITVTGYPLRSDLWVWDRQTAHTHFGISGKLPVLLVFGGSKGARSINMAVLKRLHILLERFEVIHLTGDLDWPVTQATITELPPKLTKNYHAMPYLHEMGAALAAADIVVSRAGASTLGEFPLFGLPAVLIPYPYAWRYQKTNADYLTRRGAAIILDDQFLMDELATTLNVLIDNPTKLKAMRAAMFQLSHPRAAEKIASQLIELAGEKSL